MFGPLMNATFPWVIFQISLCCKHFQKHLGSSQHTAQQNIYRRSHRFVRAAVCAQLLLTFQKFGLFISYSVRTKQRFNIQASIPQSQAFMKSIFFFLTLVPKSWAACIRTLHSTQLHWGRFSAINTTHLFSYSYIFQVSWIRSQHQQAPFVDSVLVIFQGSHQTSSPRPPGPRPAACGFPGHIFCCVRLQIISCRPPSESSSQSSPLLPSWLFTPRPSLGSPRCSGILFSVLQLICFSAAQILLFKILS